MVAEEKRKKHELKIIVILAVLCAVVYSIAAGLLLMNSGAEDPASTALNMPGAVNSVEITTEGETFTLVRNKTSWYCEEKQDIPVNSVMISIMASTFNALEPDRVIEDGNTYLQQFGLGKDAYQITAKDNTGTEKTYLVGNINDLLGQYYVKVDGTEQIYLLSKSDMTKIVKNFLNVVDNPRLADLSASQVTEYQIHNGNVDYHIFAEGEIYRFEVGSKIYDGDQYTAENIFYALKNVKFDNCVSYRADAEELAGYGLDDADITIEMKVKGDNPETIMFRIAKNDDGTAYVTARDNGIVYLITAEELEGVAEDLPLSVHIDVE